MLFFKLHNVVYILFFLFSHLAIDVSSPTFFEVI